MKLHIPTLIARKREGEILDPAEIQTLIAGYTSGEVPDYQMSAFAMAVFFRGMTATETAALTRAMLESGDTFDHGSDHPLVVDKHSTGGIGDKTSLIIAPLLACTGTWVPMVSGRGLGITGGTLDKLESIPGFNVRLSLPDAQRQLRQLHLVMMGQTDRFCPADKKLYALRDVTGTVPSIPLITASIMSKKMAESLDRLVLDVKFGSGAFMKTSADAKTLAQSMIEVGHEMGVQVHAILTPMNEPLGQSVGNSLEVIESLECLEGQGPPDLRQLVLDLCEKVSPVPRSELENLLDNGSARAKWDQLVAAQGGNPDDLKHLATIHRAPIILDFPAPTEGTVTHVDAGIIGQAALQLGAGRAKASDPVDHAVGFDQLVKTGTHVSRGQPLARIHARTAVDAEMAVDQLTRAIRLA